MRTSSNRELARQIGVSETAVRRAEKAGRIRREPDGAWDLARVQAAWSSNTDRAQQRRQHGAMKPVPEAAVGAVRDTLREHGEPVSAGRPREAEYACQHCGALIGERHKTWMLEHGEWRPTAPGDGRTAGFHLSSLYSPVGWFSWANAAEMYEQARNAPDLMKGFVNTVLGLPYEEEAEAPEWQRLYERRESYRIGVVPEPGLFLTAGVDVQKDRLEVEVVAWGRGKESWSIDYRVIEGDTARAEVWSRLDAALDRDWPHVSGHTLPIRVMCVDAGYATQDVYAWVRQHPQASWGPAGAAARQPRTAVAVKGRDRDTALLLSVSKADAGGRRRHGSALFDRPRAQPARTILATPSQQ